MGDRSRSRDRRATPKKRPLKGNGPTEQTAGASSQDALLPGARNPIRPAGYYLNLLKFDYDPDYHSESEEIAESRRKVVVLGTASSESTSPPVLLHREEGGSNLSLDSDSTPQSGSVVERPKPSKPPRTTSPRAKTGSALPKSEADDSEPIDKNKLAQIEQFMSKNESSTVAVIGARFKVSKGMLKNAGFEVGPPNEHGQMGVALPGSPTPAPPLHIPKAKKEERKPLERHKGANRDLRPAWMTRGLGVNAEIFGETKVAESSTPQKRKANLSKKQKKEKRLARGSTAEAATPSRDSNKGAGKQTRAS